MAPFAMYGTDEGRDFPQKQETNNQPIEIEQPDSLLGLHGFVTHFIASCSERKKIYFGSIIEVCQNLDNAL